MRARSLAKIQDLNDGQNYSYSAIFSSSASSRERIKKKFLAFLKDVQTEAGDHPDEDIFQINFDVFKWSE
jgi:hypothetical protein